MHFMGIGTAVPPHQYSQRECWAAVARSARYRRLAGRSRDLLKKVLLGDNGITTRSLALESLREAFDLTPDVMATRFARYAPQLAAQAAGGALRQAGLRAAEVDGLLINTCTGYLCPGLTSYVSQRLGLRPDVWALDLLGQGCGAALPNLETAVALVEAGRCAHVLSISVEVCSAAFYLDDDPGVLVSACLFGDGAAAVVLGKRPPAGARRVQWLAGTRGLHPADRDCLRFEQRGGMLRNILRKEVPVLAGRHATTALARTLAVAGVGREQVTGWIVHPGGRNVLQALHKELGLRDDELRWSAQVLREHGNLSSPSVLFALQRALEGGAAGGLWWLSAFGAGFSVHGALLRVQ